MPKSLRLGTMSALWMMAQHAKTKYTSRIRYLNSSVCVFRSPQHSTLEAIFAIKATQRSRVIGPMTRSGLIDCPLAPMLSQCIRTLRWVDAYGGRICVRTVRTDLGGGFQRVGADDRSVAHLATVRIIGDRRQGRRREPIDRIGFRRGRGRCGRYGR